jgi:hypothetical protein
LTLAAQNICLCKDVNTFGVDFLTTIYNQCGCADLDETTQLTKPTVLKLASMSARLSESLSRIIQIVKIALVLVQALVLALLQSQLAVAIQAQQAVALQSQLIAVVQSQLLAVAQVQVLAVLKAPTQIKSLSWGKL